jgi:hypothetical protein
MIEKPRYQVFISSTFSDLQDERSDLFDVLMKLDCIPAGMEIFTAFDDETLEYIKRVIDQSDYYVLIIAGRYGSLSSDGLSFTEKEYEYAVSRRIPVLAFIHAAPDKIAVGKTDKDPEKAALLQAFIERVRQGRIVKFWNNPGELSKEVTVALSTTMSRKPGIGWVRANVVASADVLADINKLRKQNEKQFAEIARLKVLLAEQQTLPMLELRLAEPATVPAVRDRNKDVEEFIAKAVTNSEMPDRIKSAIDAKAATARLPMRQVIVEELIRAQLSDIEIEKYIKKFDVWYERNSNGLCEHHRYQERMARRLLIAFEIVNEGRMPAENVTIKLSIGAGLSICDLGSKPNFDGVPEPPHPLGGDATGPEFELPFWYLWEFIDLKDANGRWLNNKENNGEIRVAIEKLEHGGEPQRLIPIGVTLADGPTSEISIRYTLHASNQPEDSKGEIHIKIDEV